MTLARLHAALDSVMETEQLIAQIHDSAAISPPTVAHLGQLVSQTRDLLRSMLSRPVAATPVGTPSTRRPSGTR